MRTPGCAGRTTACCITGSNGRRYRHGTLTRYGLSCRASDGVVTMNARRVLLLVIGLLLVAGCGNVTISIGTPPPLGAGGSQGNSQGVPGNSGSVQWGNRTKTSGCV